MLDEGVDVDVLLVYIDFFDMFVEFVGVMIFVGM